jgi:uncharacterized protein YuzE
MKVSYDHITDTLYLFVGDQTATVARDIGDGILVKYNQNNKAVGAIIHNFEQHFKTQEHITLDIPALVS